MSPAAAPATAPARGLRRQQPVRRAATPRLKVVAAPPSARSRLPFSAACVGLLGMTLVALLMLNISLSRGAYQVHELELQRALLAEQQQALSGQLAHEASPGRLAERAAGLGMVPNPHPAFVRLSDGAVLGTPTPAPPPAP
jgi:hypothetical protein